MFAEKALGKSECRMIGEHTPQGFITILHEPGSEYSPPVFHLSFVPRDALGQLLEQGTIVIGSYDDLDTAITIAAVKYGSSEKKWIPVLAGLSPIDARTMAESRKPIID